MTSSDADDELDDDPRLRLLPKDDRLWRHPSEIEESPRPWWWLPFRRPADRDPTS
jgi:hypothetical protein